jgi:hypothetical protein
LPLIEGRYFTPTDEGKAVAILSASVVRKMLPGRNPIGTHLRWNEPGKNEPLFYQVVGVVGDARAFADRSAPPIVYIPAWIWSPYRASPVVRSAADLHTTAGEMQEAVRSLDPKSPFRMKQRWATWSTKQSLLGGLSLGRECCLHYLPPFWRSLACTA